MSGIGNISNAGGVGYTEINGLGLNPATQNQVKLDAAVSTAMSSDILKALTEFRAEGNFNPTAAEMEAKLSVVGVATKQADINQAQDLLFGLQQTYQLSLQATGQNATGGTQVWYQLVESGGTVPANALCDGAPSPVAGKSIAGVFGSTVASYPGGPEALLSSLIPNTFNTDRSLNLPPGYWGDGHLTPAAMKTMITALQTKIANMESADPSSFHDTTGATQMTAAQWLSKEMGVQSPHDSYSIEQWAEIAEKFQINAAKKTSQLSLGQGGGIQQVNGQYFVNGEEMSLSQINFCVRANQYQLIDQQIADQLDAVQRNSEKAKQAQAVLAAFKQYDGETIGVNQSATIDLSGTGMINSGGGGWGVVQHYLNSTFGVTGSSNPSYQNYSDMMTTGTCHKDAATEADMKSKLEGFFNTLKAASPTFYSSHFTDTNGAPPYTVTGTISNAEFTDLKTAFGTWLQANSTDNQVEQQRLEALNNTRQSVLDGMGAFTQGQSQVTTRIAGNF